MNKDFLKKCTVFIFLSSIAIAPVTMLLTEDKKVNEIENKILTQLPRFNYSNIKSGRFMSEFDNYVSDQFPARNLFLYSKNRINYLLGNREFRNIYLNSSGKLLEKYGENLDTISYNIDKINSIVDKLDLKKDLFIVPNSVAIYGDTLPSYYPTDSQEDSILKIKHMTDINVYSPIEVLNSNKKDYIYFNTDHHWTQLGAKIAFEDFYNKKIESKYSLTAKNFLGTYYSKAMLNNIKGDTIYSYLDFKNFKCEFDGESYDSLYDDSKLSGKNKYQYFLNGDPAEGVIYGSGKGEILVIKDSFAHAFIPFLATEYEKVHVIDPRYSNSDISEYVKSNENIEEVLFLLSLSTINSNKIFK